MLALMDKEFARPRGRYAGYTRTRLAQFARRLQRKIHPEAEAVATLELAGPCDRISYADAQKLTYRKIELGEPLGPLWSTYWLRVSAQVPEYWKGARVDLHWDSRSEAMLYIGGRSVQGLNIGRDSATLIKSAKGGETVAFEIEIACNRAFGIQEDGLPPREPYRLATCELVRFDPDAWSLFHDFDVLRELEADREPAQVPRSFGGVAPKIVRPALDTAWSGKLLHELNRVCNLLDPDDKTTWPAGRTILHALLTNHNGTTAHELSAIGHAHIDTAWLWPIEETTRKCQRSFANAVALMDEYPDFKFACSQAYQYAVIEETDPDLFARIRAKAKTGQWIPIGGSWVEPDCNLPSGEAMCRQFLYGQRYFESTFGARATVFWNPDVFGYAGQLPQLMQEAGIGRFLTQKLSWNKFTAPPHHSFHWRGIDGSSVLTHFPPADTYNGVATMEELRYHAANHKDADRTDEALYLFGYGDGGGGPNAHMIERLARARDLQGVPRSEIRDPHVFFDRLEKDTGDLMTVEGELYFEYHRGTYTSQSNVKKFNRLAEQQLQALDFACAATALAGKAAPSRQAVEKLWRVLLTNQFHDILPGSSIAEVYQRADVELAELCESVKGETQRLLDGFSSGNDVHPVNTLGVARDEVAAAPDGTLHFVTAPPFASGRVVTTEDRASAEDDGKTITLQNRHLIAVFAASGDLISLRHRASSREALSGPANRILLYDDRPVEFEAWDIDPFALETARLAEPAHTHKVLADGGLRAEVRFERKLGKKSRLTQTVRLDADSPKLEFDTTIDWKDRRTLVKAAFPIAVRSSRATFETMFGAVERPTHASTDADHAQFEVPGHRWADLAEPGFGVSLLSDARYGYSAFDDVLTLSFVRGTMSPDRGADLGEHRFRYALYPHEGDWRDAGTVAEAAQFNRPVMWLKGAPHDILKQPLAASSHAAVIVDTIKPAEDGKGWIVRLYESTGSTARTRLSFGVPVREAFRSNTLEDKLDALPLNDGALELALRPFQFMTVLLK